MSLFRKLLGFFVYSNLFIAVCAVLMVIQTYHLVLDERADPYFTAFVFFSTICSYSFHWYLETPSILSSPRLQWQHRHHRMHLVFFIMGLLGAGIFFFFLSNHWRWLALAACVTFLYSAPKIRHPWFRALRRFAIGKTIFLAFVWMFVTSCLPVLLSDNEWNTGTWLFVSSRFFLILCICILFDYRDRADDRLNGIRSLVTFLDDRGVGFMFLVSFLFFVATTLGLLDFGYPVGVVVILLSAGLLAAALFNHAKRNFSDLLYYFVLDGLMAFPAFLTLILGI